MPALFDHLAARAAILHARRIYNRFLKALDHVEHSQERVLRRVLRLVARGDYGRRFGLERVRSVADLRRAAPLVRYDDIRPYADRVADGDSAALFRPDQRVLMFATSSGTTALPKRIPVTPEFVADYRRGWNTFGLKLLSDHPRAILRSILQSSSRYDTSYTAGGIPCGAITGLLARTQKRIVRRYYVGGPGVPAIEPAGARYYTLMRLGVARDVAFAVTANPATLILMARTADEHSETLIRDVRDGALSPPGLEHPAALADLAANLRPDPARARELEVCRQQAGGRLRPRDYWRLEFLACWTGGSMGYHLERLADWWGPLPVRDVGLLASEGRVSLPLADNTPAGVLDVTSAVFEFIPAAEAEAESPQVLMPSELQPGQDYAVVLTNTAGLVRYRLDDIVRVRGFLRQAPIIEFLHRAGRVSSITGEKLTENQVVAAVAATRRALRLPEFDFIMAPRWADPPYYVLSCTYPAESGLARGLEAELAAQNEEYASRRKSNRLGPLRVRCVAEQALRDLDLRIAAARCGAAEQYKRPCLFINPGEDDRWLQLTPPAAADSPESTTPALT